MVSLLARPNDLDGLVPYFITDHARGPASSSATFSVRVEMDRRRVKDGIIKRYQNIGRSWKKTYGVLYSDTTFEWYDKKGGSKAGSVLLKHISPLIRVGQECDQLAVPRPNIPNEYSIHHLVAVGSNPSAERFFWFLCSSDEDFNSWHSQIVTTVLSCLLPQITTQTRSMPQTPATTLPSIGFEHLNSRDQTTVSTNPSGTYQTNVNRPLYPQQDNFPSPNRPSHLQLSRPSSSPQLPNTPPYPPSGHLPTPPISENSTSIASNTDTPPSGKKKSIISKFFRRTRSAVPVAVDGTHTDQSAVSTNPSGSYQSNVNRPSHLQLSRPSSSPQLPSTEPHPPNGHMPTSPESQKSTTYTPPRRKKNGIIAIAGILGLAGKIGGAIADDLIDGSDPIGDVLNRGREIVQAVGDVIS
ncbi:hypothetical protein QR680_006936 [Steinernema hermaphroditum]|uniref:PH domain-containing protein n=1 Tax=Steinernema hermaphroditum TaxID=289476 RepID=A0AA39HZ80_9BILA|nr:hypothetical protein QR680_006936 [Steinernema hermaphroditum]